MENDQAIPTHLTPDEMMQLLQEALGQGTSSTLTRETRARLISELPRLTEEQIAANGHTDSCCPICFVSFPALMAEEETALAMDSPAHSIEDLGVTRLLRCGHHFCRRDISQWMRQGNAGCPTCRRPFEEDETPPPNAERVPLQDAPMLPGLPFLIGADEMDETVLNRAIAALQSGQHVFSMNHRASTGPREAEEDSSEYRADNDYSAMYS